MTTPTPSGSAIELYQQAKKLVAAHQWPAAEAILETLVRNAPRNPMLRMELASVMQAAGKLRAANEQLLEAARTLPNDARAIIQLVPKLCFNGENRAARACLEQLAQAPHPPAHVQAAHAHLRWMVGDIPASLELTAQARAAGADEPEDHYLHAMMLQFSGDIEQAGTLLEAALRRWPEFGDAAVMLAGLRRQTPESNHLDLLGELLGRIPPGRSDPATSFLRAELEYARFKELDDLGRHDEAWPALERGNRLMHRIRPYDADREEAVVDAITRRTASAPAASAPPFTGPTPIFVVGLPRSGSTLLDRMLSNHSQVASAGEIDDFMCQLRWATDVPPGGTASLLKVIERMSQVDVAELGARYLAQTQWRARGRPFYVDKLPSNIRVVDMIRRALPHAPILHTVREPMDVCFSNLKAMFGRASAYSYDMPSLGHYYGQYRRLADHWRHTLPGAMLDVSYESLVRDTSATMQRVLEHCGLDLEQGCLHPEGNTAPVTTMSSAQVREPIHTRSIGEWRRYASQLEPLRLAIG